MHGKIWVVNFHTHNKLFISSVHQLKHAKYPCIIIILTLNIIYSSPWSWLIFPSTYLQCCQSLIDMRSIMHCSVLHVPIIVDFASYVSISRTFIFLSISASLARCQWQIGNNFCFVSQAASDNKKQRNLNWNLPIQSFTNQALRREEKNSRPQWSRSQRTKAASKK